MVDYRYQQAWDYRGRGQNDRAIELLKQLLSEDPNHAMCHGLLASCLLEKKRLHAAEHELAIALRLAPINAYLVLTQARVFVFKNKPKQALTCCDDALAINPELSGALLLKSNIYALLDKKSERFECLQQAASLDPNSVDVITAIGDFYHSTGKHKKAFEVASDALAMDPQDVDANVLMGKIQLVLGNAEDAEYHAMFAISQNPESEAALKLFSNIKMRKNIFLGLWWRFNSWITTAGNLKSSAILVFGYLLFTLLSRVLADLEYEQLSDVTSYSWLAIVVYSWVCIPMYYKQLKKEVEKFRFDSDF